MSLSEHHQPTVNHVRVGPRFWGSHFDQVAVQSGQTIEGLVERRNDLIQAVAELLAQASQYQSNRITGDAYKQIATDFRDTWHCDDSWLNRTLNLIPQFEGPPTQEELTTLLGYPTLERLTHKS